MVQLFKDRNFLLFWIGELVSVIGDHMSFIAFPWLVLGITGSPMMMGLVLAVQGLPRALLMLVGGAVVDRTSPRKVMMATNLVRMAIMLVLGYLLMINEINMALILGGALIFGVADAFFYPANTSILPSLVKKDKLQGANALVQMTMQLGIVIGPVLAGIIIAGEISSASHEVSGLMRDLEEDREGLARAFLLDAGTFAFSAITLMFVKVRKLGEDTDESSGSLVQDIKEALAFVWSIPAARLAFIGIAGLEFFFQAPLFVGLPALMKLRFAEGAFIYGIVTAAYGIGALIGGVTAGTTGPIKRTKLVRRLFLIFAWSGATVGLIVIFPAYEVAMLLFFSAGLGDAYIWVHFMTFLQKITPEKLLGRVMSFLMFMAIGLVPVANLVMGFVFEWDVEIGLMIAGAALVIVCLTCALHKDASNVQQISKGTA